MGYSTTLGLNDRMSPVLKTMMKSLDSTLDYMRKIETAGNNGAASQAYERARRDIDQANNALLRFENNTQHLQQTANNTGNSFAGWQKSIILANQALGLVKGTLGSLGVFNVDKAFNRIDTMKQFGRSMSIMTGSKSVAKTTLADLRSGTVGTGYGLDSAAAATQGFVTRDMDPAYASSLTQSLMDATTFYGKGTTAQFETVVDAIGKMKTKGSVDMIELNRLFSVGINAVGLYAKETGRSSAAVQADLSNNKIRAEEFIEVFKRGIDTGAAAGAAKAMGDTWATTLENVQAAAARGWVSVIEKTDRALAVQGMPSTLQMLQQTGEKIETILNKVGDISATLARHTPAVKAFAGSLAMGTVLTASAKGLSALRVTTNQWALSTLTATAAQRGLTLSTTTTTAGTRGLTAAQNAATAASLRLAMAEMGTAQATKALAVAVATNPLFIGLTVVTAIMTAVTALDYFNKKAADASGIIQVQTMSLRELKNAQNASNRTYSDSMRISDRNKAVSEKYLKTIGQLEKQEKLNAYEQKQLQTAVSGLNSVYPNLGLQIDSTTGKLNLNTAAIEKNISGLHRLAQAQALQDRLTSKYSELYEAKATAAKAQSSANRAAPVEEAKRQIEYKLIGASGSTLEAHGIQMGPNSQKEADAAKRAVSLLQREIDVTAKQINKLGVNLNDNGLPDKFRLGGGDIDTIGKIKNDVKISEDDIKLLKDVAEKEFALKIAQITPQVTAQFGDVRETADVRGIMVELEDMVSAALQSNLKFN